MSDLQAIRRTRLREELKLLEAIRCEAIQWSLDGDPPRVINVTYNIRSVVSPTGGPGGGAIYRDIHHLVVDIPPRFPLQEVTVRMQDGVKTIYHPNFWPNGFVCTRGADVPWDMSESLASVIVRVGRMLQFDPHLTQESHRANGAAADWYKVHKDSGLFPTDRQVLPSAGTDDGSDFEIKEDFTILETW